MKIKNSHVQPLMDFLFQMELAGRKSRMRTRLIRLLEEHYVNVIQAENKVLIDECAEKDENGQIVINHETEMINLIPDKANYYHIEYNDLMNEYFHLEENKQNSQMIKEIHEILESYDEPMSGQIAMVYDDVCMAFEDAVVIYSMNLEEEQNGDK